MASNAHVDQTQTGAGGALNEVVQINGTACQGRGGRWRKAARATRLLQSHK